jgi:predicted Zn-dependent protease
MDGSMPMPFNTQLNEAIRLKRGKKYISSWEIFSSLSRCNPQSAFFWSNFAHLAFVMNRFQEARQFAEHALSIDSKSRFSRSLYAEILLKQKEINSSLEILRELVEEKMEVPLLKKLIKASEQNDKLVELENYFDEWIQKYMDNVEFATLAAEFYHKIGKTDRSIEIYQQIVSDGKATDFAYERLIALKTKGKSSPEKIYQLETILKLHSQEKNIHLLGLLAQEYKNNREWDKAEQVYRKIMSLAPDNLFQKKQMGFLYAKKRDWERTIETLTDCLLNDPDDHFVRNSLLSACKKTGKKQEALQLIDKILNRYPEMRNYFGIRKKVEKW